MAMYRSYSHVTIPRSCSSSSLSGANFGAAGHRSRRNSFSAERSPQIFPLGRSSSQVFATARSTQPAAHHLKTPYSTTPYFSDTYPHVRHSHGFLADSSAVKLISSLPGYSRHHYSSNRGESFLTRAKRDSFFSSPSLPTYTPHSQSSYSIYSPPAYSPPAYSSRADSRQPSYSSSTYTSPRQALRSYVGDAKIDNAVGLYSKKYMTVGALSKYFLSPSVSTPNLSGASAWRTRSSQYESPFKARDVGSASYSSRYGTDFYGGSNPLRGYTSNYYTPSSYRRYLS